jgi:hypothetical protein
MRSAPPEVLKTWPKPNYVNPTTRGNTLMILELTLLPIAMVVVFLRMWVRISWLRKVGIDDWVMLVAMIFSIGTVSQSGLHMAVESLEIHVLIDS